MTLQHVARTENKWRGALRWHEEIVVAPAGWCWSCCCHCHCCRMPGPVWPYDDEEL